MKLINEVHPETREILLNVMASYRKGEISDEERDEIIRSCFRAEEERKFQERSDLK